MKKMILAFVALTAIMCFTSVDAKAQTFPLKITIIDANTGEPVPGISVFIQGTLTGVVTDINGEATIYCTMNDVLGVAIVGHQIFFISVRQIIANGGVIYVWL